MSEHMPIPMNPTFRNVLRVHDEVRACGTIRLANDMTGSEIGAEIVFHVVLREARIPALIQGQIRRIHHRADAVELYITNTDETYTEWSTFTLDPNDVVLVMDTRS